VVEAVDGNALAEEERNKVYRHQLHTPHYPFGMNSGEIGCFLSHRNVWQRMVDANLDAALVLEDDVELEPGFDDAFAFACATIRHGDYLQFRVHPLRGQRCSNSLPFTVHKPVVTGFGTVAQLVSRGAAERLIAFTREFDRPIDTLLQMKWLTGVAPAAVLPSFVREISQGLGGSTIQRRKTSLSQFLFRELARPVYRARIARLSRRFSRSSQ
jgi:GR25 family glycosyltransferase involved in LPS biosynthesis